MLRLIVEATDNGGVVFTHRVSSMVIAGVFLRGRKQADPAFHLRRQPSRSRQRNSWLNPPIVGHRKRFYSLPPRAISSACAIAPVREQDRADGSSIRAI